MLIDNHLVELQLHHQNAARDNAEHGSPYRVPSVCIPFIKGMCRQCSYL